MGSFFFFRVRKMPQDGVSIGSLAINELIIPGVSGCYEISDIFYTGQSEFQKVHVVDLKAFGRTLFLDQKMQSSASDEFIYHESLVYPALLTHPNPKNVLILGGGEGGTSREALRFKSVERLVMVDIDEVVVETSKQFLTSYHRGAWENSRLEVVIGCAKKYLEETDVKWDVIIGDLADPTDGGPCYLLYTVEFYKMLAEKLAPNGIFVTQSGPCGLYSVDEVCLPVYNTLSEVFKNTTLYHAHCPAFFDHYAFTMASNDVDTNFCRNGDVVKRIEERVDATHETDATPEDVGAAVPRSIDEETLQSYFIWPKWLKDKSKENKTIIRDDSPSYLS